MTQKTPISEKVDRIESIVDTLENGDVSLEDAEELHEEGQTLLEELQDDLDVGDGTVIEQWFYSSDDVISAASSMSE